MSEDEHRKEAMTDEERAWLESDLSRLSDFEPYEWAEGELEAGDPVRYAPGVGAVAGGEEPPERHEDRGGEDWVPYAEDHEPAKRRAREVEGPPRGRARG